MPTAMKHTAPSDRRSPQSQADLHLGRRPPQDRRRPRSHRPRHRQDRNQRPHPQRLLHRREAIAKAIFGPLEVTNTGGKMDIWSRCNGGGPTGQAGAIVMGLGRALAKYDSALEVALRSAGFLTRDSRMKERKKYGQRGAADDSSSPSDKTGNPKPETRIKPEARMAECYGSFWFRI